MNPPKLQYFEGIRGIAALIVVFDHLDFVFSLNLDSKIFEIIFKITNFKLLAESLQSVFSFFLNGNLAVYIFFFMSGYVISIKLFKNESKSYLISATFKRYFRLMPPILGSVLLGFVLMKFDLIYSIELAKSLGTENALGYFYNFQPSFLSALKSGIWNVLFTKSLGGYNGPLWTMRPEFYGSLSCFLLFLLFNKFKFRHSIYCLIILLSFFINTPWLTTFILGFIICDLSHSSEILKKTTLNIKNRLTKLPLTTISLCVLWIILTELTGFNSFQYSNAITSTLLVCVIMYSSKLQKLFELKPILWLGKTSFSIYLLHWPILCSLGSYIYITSGLPRNINVMFSSSISILSILIIAVIYSKVIDQSSIIIANKIARKSLLLFKK